MYNQELFLDLSWQCQTQSLTTAVEISILSDGGDPGCPYVMGLHCVKSVPIRSYSGLHSVRMRENMDQNNSEQGHFSRSALVLRSSGKIPVLSQKLKLYYSNWLHRHLIMVLFYSRIFSNMWYFLNLKFRNSLV